MMKRRQLVKSRLGNSRGFTLIETIAVLIILAILAAIVISRVSSNNDLIPQADIVKSHLRFAQLKALQDDRSDTEPWGINFGGGSYTLYRNNNNASPLTLPSENSSTHTFPVNSGITVTSETVNFDSWGNPVGGDATVTLNQSGSTPIVITVNANTGYITP